MIPALLSGFALGGSLIVAIGAQNAFVIRQGVIGRHLFLVCLFCALSDAILIWCGTYGLATILKALPQLITVMTYGGAAFLIHYGVKALRRALHPSAMDEAQANTDSLWPTLATCAAFTWLNPHVYLDTVILVGSIANAVVFRAGLWSGCPAPGSVAPTCLADDRFSHRSHHVPAGGKAAVWMRCQCTLAGIRSWFIASPSAASREPEIEIGEPSALKSA
jgi:arginine exporter protein ArgO